MKRTLSIIIAFLILGGIIWYSFKSRPEVISKDTTIKGDYTLQAGKRLALSGGTKFRVEGNLEIDGELSCQKGSLNLMVTGKAELNGKVKCEEPDGSVNVVASQGIIFGKNSEIQTQGNVQIVENENLFAVNSDQVRKLYEEVEKETTGGQRVGPLVSKETEATSFSQTQEGLAKSSPRHTFSLISKAEALSHTVVIGGKVTVATPPPGVKRIVVFNFPTAVGMEIKDFELTGPDGRNGADDRGNSCNAKGKDGEDAFRFLATAGNIKVNNFTLNLGNGGKGGDAETTKDCDPGIATGGRGGKSGNFKMVAANDFQITGAFVIQPGKGGDGGKAIAHGKDGGPSQKGGDATATGGRGADNTKELGIAGTVAGTSNVQIGSVIGGNGSSATANPGKGGDGIGCAAKGGEGGKGTATGGQGGKASLTLAGNAGRTPGAQDQGGNGGDADSHGGKGGKGGDCGPEGPGGPGGKGGDAKSTKGSGGTGTTANGQDGVVKDETGGDGGNGGDGCPEGPGGKGGSGKPSGKDGKPGKNLCLPPQENNTITPPPPPPTTNPPTPTPPPASSKPKIQVIQYQGKYLPVAQLIVESEIGCGAAHWHAAEGVVRATDGTIVPDPGPPCGYGKQSETPILQIEAP